MPGSESSDVGADYASVGDEAALLTNLVLAKGRPFCD
jgi:hypothetical protein